MGKKIETPNYYQEDRDVIELDCKDLQAISNGQNINISFKHKQKRNNLDKSNNDTDLSVQLRRGIFKKNLKDESQSGSFIEDNTNNSKFDNTFKSVKKDKKDSLISQSMDNDSLFVISKFIIFEINFY